MEQSPKTVVIKISFKMPLYICLFGLEKIEKSFDPFVVASSRNSQETASTASLKVLIDDRHALVTRHKDRDEEIN